MPPMLAKTILAFVLLLTVTPCVYGLTTLLWLEFLPRYYSEGPRSTLMANLVTAMVLYILWVSLWRREARSTKARRAKTLGAFAFAVGLAMLVFACADRLASQYIAMDLAGLTWACVWIGSTTFFWRQKTPSERPKQTKKDCRGPLRCPTTATT